MDIGQEEKLYKMSYEEKLRKKVLEKIEDLKKKIENNEDMPHGKQDINLLVDIDDNLEECLTNWYY